MMRRIASLKKPGRITGRVFLHLAFYCPAAVQADVFCPTLGRDPFLAVAHGTITSAIEPIYETECARNALGQCEGRLERRETVFRRLVFEADELFYISPEMAFVYLSSHNVPAGSRIEDVPGFPHRIVVVGRQDDIGKTGLLAASAKYKSPDEGVTGDLEMAGCQALTEPSDPSYAARLEKARGLRQ